jgi:hypothetical protein
MTQKNGQAAGMKSSPARQAQRKRAVQNAAKRAAARSGEVVTRVKGEEKTPPPPPTKAQIDRQRRRL